MRLVQNAALRTNDVPTTVAVRSKSKWIDCGRSLARQYEYLCFGQYTDTVIHSKQLMSSVFADFQNHLLLFDGPLFVHCLSTTNKHILRQLIARKEERERDIAPVLRIRACILINFRVPLNNTWKLWTKTQEKERNPLLLYRRFFSAL